MIDRRLLLNCLTQERFNRRHSSPARPFTVGDCLRLIREQPAAARWIPVEEKLPPPETEVLCAFDSGDRCSLWQNWAQAPHAEPFLYGEDATFQVCRRVTHWLPLPPPPEKGECPCPTTM